MDGNVGPLKVKSEEKLLPLLRARLAKKLVSMGFQEKEIAEALNVTPPAVTQYLKGKRGRGLTETKNLEQTINALAEKTAQRIRTKTGPLDIAELLDAGYQILTATRGEKTLQSIEEPRKERWLRILRERLQLELQAAEKCLGLASRTPDDFGKLLLRMIASDSIRHAYIVTQLIAWLEKGGPSEFKPPAKELLSDMLRMEDTADEVSLSKTLRVTHGIARLLLESIDMDEQKHKRVLTRMMKMLD